MRRQSNHDDSQGMHCSLFAACRRVAIQTMGYQARLQGRLVLTTQLVSKPASATSTEMAPAALTLADISVGSATVQRTVANGTELACCRAQENVKTGSATAHMCDWICCSSPVVLHVPSPLAGLQGVQGAQPPYCRGPGGAAPR